MNSTGSKVGQTQQVVREGSTLRHGASFSFFFFLFFYYHNSHLNQHLFPSLVGFWIGFFEILQLIGVCMNNQRVLAAAIEEKNPAPKKKKRHNQRLFLSVISSTPFPSELEKSSLVGRVLLSTPLPSRANTTLTFCVTVDSCVCSPDEFMKYIAYTKHEQHMANTRMIIAQP